MMQQRTLASLLVILGAFGWSVRDVANKLMQEREGDKPSVWTITAVQGAIGLILNFTISQGKLLINEEAAERREVISGKEKIWLVVRVIGAISGITLHILSLGMVDLALASMIHCTAPIFIVVLSRVFLGEPIRLGAGLAMSLCAVGLILDIAPWKGQREQTGGGSVLGYTLAFGSALGSAFAYTSLRALKGVSPTTSLQTLYISLLVFGFFPALAEGIAKPTLEIWGLFVMVGTATYCSEWLITKGYALAAQGAGSVAVFKFLTPIFEIGWNVVLFQRFPTALSIVGATLVVVSSAVLVHVQAGQKNEHSECDDKAGKEADPATFGHAQCSP
jgi:drug/metabolite transporter (DMT)-like permease